MTSCPKLQGSGGNVQPFQPGLASLCLTAESKMDDMQPRLTECPALTFLAGGSDHPTFQHLPVVKNTDRHSSLDSCHLMLFDNA